MSGEARLAAAMWRATRAVEGELGEPLQLLERGGVFVKEVDLSDSKLSGFVEMVGVRGYGMRMLRHGSHPGARLELAFSGNPATSFFAPGMAVRGGFKTAAVKRAKGCARVGKASIAVFNDPAADISEDLIISAIGPVDLLGACDVNGDPTTWVTIPEETVPNAAYGTQTGAFDAAGWELLRVMVKATDITTATFHAFHNTSWVGTTWSHCSMDGVFPMDDSPSTGHDWRTFMVPWGGRGVGYIGVWALNPGGLTGVDMIVQGVK